MRRQKERGAVQIPDANPSAALRDFDTAYVADGSRPVIRQCRLNVRFARKQIWQGDYGYQPERGRRVYHCPFFYGRSAGAAVSACRAAHSIRLRLRRAALMAPYVMDSRIQARGLPTPSAAGGLGGAASHPARHNLLLISVAALLMATSAAHARFELSKTESHWGLGVWGQFAKLARRLITAAAIRGAMLGNLGFQNSRRLVLSRKSVPSSSAPIKRL
jgi:hypothetical protein